VKTLVPDLDVEVIEHADRDAFKAWWTSHRVVRTAQKPPLRLIWMLVCTLRLT
jgi:hypothetical protein